MVEENTRRLCFQFLSQNPRSTSAMVGDEGDSSILITVHKNFVVFMMILVLFCGMQEQVLLQQ
ncbi:hypothetical protein HanRHA438_Chr00c03g0844451 [Helianthus annuus]|uniref:Uncharacterized protein n=1 Tax=Helianthus annuus TaxID=4232 RepID=A0A251V5U6_HELAN|nr:hypothetical protein HanXRQr2_Chr03g0106601 [Helianthus annuus]KAJ0592758.1 hypothetical protein HanHA300_Chr03g0088901 [Helianthus annuus]KAJ0600411.1 hypothetical protein HanIR_Chr03g0116321 [Helianthus annuus]KAJ0607756.1 hypothetical protein HanHA89_Chr03g0100491 [Helianthus annuus]KAJ0767820.1 hypothetical protein HanLR1_Chr03g0093861 [Helianthus annuus]